eukprot:gene32365-5056_t
MFAISRLVRSALPCGRIPRISCAQQFEHQHSIYSSALLRFSSGLDSDSDDKPALVTKKIGFLGGGMMAEALIRGFIDKGVIKADQVSVFDPKEETREKFAEMGAHAYDNNIEVSKHSDVLFIAVKPQVVGLVMAQIKSILTEKQTVVSIAAGITIARLLEWTSPNMRMIRVMPNTPCLVGETASAMCLGGKAGPEDEAIIHALFNAVGKIYTLEEKQIAAVTGVAGSGPAYVFMMIEAMADGAVKAGLPRAVAQSLAAQTVLGSAKMVLETGMHPGALKDMVTSPGGTTIAAVHELERSGMRAAFMNAVTAAANRANELAKM